VFTPLNNLEIDIVAFSSSLLFDGVHPVKYESIFNGVHLWFKHILGLFSAVISETCVLIKPRSEVAESRFYHLLPCQVRAPDGRSEFLLGRMNKINKPY